MTSSRVMRSELDRLAMTLLHRRFADPHQIVRSHSVPQRLTKIGGVGMKKQMC
jgi:hypothetical protein